MRCSSRWKNSEKDPGGPIPPLLILKGQWICDKGFFNRTVLWVLEFLQVEGKEISASHLKLRKGTPSASYRNLPFLLCSIVSEARPTHDFLRGPHERTKGTLVLCSCPAEDLARLIYHWSQSLLRRVKVAASRGLTLPAGLRLSVPRQLFLRSPGLSLQQCLT